MILRRQAVCCFCERGFQIRFNAQATAAQLLPVADLLGIPVSAGSPRTAVEAVGQKIDELIGQMNLPQRLRDAGVPLQQSDLPKLAQLGFQNRSVQNNPRPVTDAAQIEKLLSGCPKRCNASRYSMAAIN